ncbi:MAG TPA: sulfatase-like hydrolase/transferase, partial [Planctomycetota bacterium]|nr:sulfatase-like hydrolase/transferase [Planctomycetota bacterium]
GHADEYMAGAHYALWMEEKGFTGWRDHFMSWPPVEGEKHRRHRWSLPEEFHYSTWTAERTVANIEIARDEKRPFFIWSSFHDPHPPYLVPEPWDTMYDPADVPYPQHTPGEFDRMPPHFAMTQQPDPDFQEYRETFGAHGFHSHLVDESLMRKNIAVYYGMVSLMDKCIGRILDALDRTGLADDTLVVFTTDHGHFLGQHGLVAKPAFHYEDMLRLPMLVRWPGEVPAGRLTGALQSLVDFAPTFLKAAGLEAPGFMQGVSQLDVWRGGARPARTDLIVENRHEPTKVHLRTFIDERYKVTVYRDRPWGEMFDLVEDPDELHNLWDEPGSASLKTELLHRFVLAELRREPTRMPRVSGA